MPKHPNDSGDLSPAGACLGLGLILAVSVGARAALAGLVIPPSILGDEWYYVELARSLPRGGALSWGGVPLYFPSWLYPALMAAPLATLRTGTAVDVIRWINALLMSSTALLTYGFAREATTSRRALGAAALAALIPGLVYSATFLLENVFLPAFVAASWLGYRAIVRPTVGARIAAGVALAAALYAKPTGFILPLIFGLTVLGAEIGARVPGGPAENLASRALTVGRHYLTAAAYLLALLPRFLIAAFLENQHDPLSLEGLLGSYASHLERGARLDPAAFAGVGLACLAVWALGAGLSPAAALVGEVSDLARGAAERRRRILAIQTLLTLAVLLIMVVRHTLRIDPEWQVHERYFMVGYPLTLILFAARVPPGRRPFARTGLATLPWLLPLAGIVYAGRVLFRHSGWRLITNTPSLGGLGLFLLPQQLPGGMWPVIYGTAGLLGILFGVARFFQPLRWVAVAGLLAALNLGWYGAHAFSVRPIVLSDHELARDVEDALPPGHRLLILRDGLHERTIGHAGFWNPGLTVYVANSSAVWYSRPLEVGPEGRIVSPFEVEKSWLLASRQWQFNKPPVKNFGTALLYRFGAREPLTLAPDQALVQRPPAPEADPSL